MQRHINKRTHLVKFVHGLLPTNVKLHRVDPRRNRFPSCQARPETWYHILRCKSEAHTQWQTTMVKVVARKCDDLHTMPRLKAILLQALQEWCLHSNDEAPYQLSAPRTAPAAIRRLVVYQQNAIGWEHVFLGRFSSKLSYLQDEYYARRAHSIDTTRQTGLRWQIALISTLWNQWFLLWAIRNQSLHGADSKTRTQAERREVDRMLVDIYDVRNQMEPSIQQLLCQDITEHFTKSVSYNKNWLAVYGPLVRQSIQRAKLKAIQGVKSIKSYFGSKQ